MRDGLGALAGCALLLGAQAAPAALVNGDFDAAFDGWSAEIADTSFVSTIGSPADFPANFDASGGEAVLRTSAATDDIFFVTLFQSFVIESVPLSPGQSLQLSYSLAAALSDASRDSAFAQLSHGPAIDDVIDLVGPTTLDVTFLAGRTVELLFGVQDIDNVADTLTIDNVAVTVVPIPAVGLSGLLVALAGMGWLQRRPRAAA